MYAIRSYYVNENPAISAETREKVLKVMKDLDYVPNSMARALSNQRAFTVTLAINAEDVKSFNNPFFYEVMHGIEKVVYQKDLCLIIANMQTVIKKESILTWLINGKRTQGIILPSSLATEKNIKELNKHHFPFVVFGEPDSPDPLNWVDVNNRHVITSYSIHYTKLYETCFTPDCKFSGVGCVVNECISAIKK